MPETQEDQQQPEQPPKPGPKPQPQQQNPQADSDTPPWGDDFDPEKAWSLVKNLRGDKEKQKQQLEQAAADREELERLRNEKLTADERALQEAVEKAQAEARSAAESEWRPKYQTAQLRGIAGSIIKDPDRLESFMSITDSSKFVGEDGDIDQEKVMGHLTAIFVANQPPPSPRQWGQYSGPGNPPKEPGEGGKAEAAKRFGTKTS